MSHELGALLLTETIINSLNNDKPVFAIFLDARSAFDKTIKEIMIQNVYVCKTNDQRLVYLNNRLENRSTFCEWDTKIMGPINDEVGVEQGGVPSSDLYTIYNTEQLDNAQDLGLGIDVHDNHIAAIGQADDVVCLSNDVNSLKNIVEITIDYYNK